MVRSGTTTGRYRMAEHGQASRKGAQGINILLETAGCMIYKPTWNKTHTIVRPYPARNPENPAEWDPFRLSDERRDYGDWIRKYEAVRIGTPGITFILRDPRDVDIDMQQNPAWMTYRALNSGVRSGQCPAAWNPLILGQAGKGSPVAQPTDIYLFQGALMERQSKAHSPPLGLEPAHQTMVMFLPQSAGDSLLDTALEEKNEDGTLKYDDICRLDQGAFIDIYQSGTPAFGGVAVGAPAAAPQSMANMSTGAGGGGGGMEANRYEVSILETYNGVSPALDSLTDQICAKLKSWDDIVRIPDIPEQVRMICGAGLPASAVIYALGEAYGEHIPEATMEQAQRESTATSVPVGAPQGGAQDMGGMQTANPAVATPPAGAPVADPSMPTVAQSAPVAGVPGAAATAPAGPSSDAAPPAAPAPPADPVAAVAAPPAGPPAAAPAAATPPAAAPATTSPTTPPAAGTPAAQGFDAQPTHADPEQATATMDALSRARARVNDPATQPAPPQG
jgi:hypothetical protein